MKIQFDATIDEVVDANQRVMDRSKTIRSWRLRDLIITAVSTGIISYALTRKVILGIIAAAVAGVIYLPLRRYMLKQRLRKYIVEAYKSEGPIDVQIELTPAGIHVQQSGTRSIYDWNKVEVITETDDTVDIFFKQGGGGLIVRRRAFTSTEQQRQFVALAEEYCKQAAVQAGTF